MSRPTAQPSAGQAQARLQPQRKRRSLLAAGAPRLFRAQARGPAAAARTLPAHGDSAAGRAPRAFRPAAALASSPPLLAALGCRLPCWREPRLRRRGSRGVARGPRDSFPRAATSHPGKGDPARRGARRRRAGRGWAGGASGRCPLGGPGAASRAGRGRARAQGGPCLSPRWRRSAAHVSRRHVRARPRLASAAAPRAVGRGCARRLLGRSRDDAGRRRRAGLGTRASPSGRRGPAAPRTCPAPNVSARAADWAPWRGPGARRPRGAHRVDLGGPAAGRRPRVHGWLGAR